MVKMKKLFVPLCSLVLILGVSGLASAALFDFEEIAAFNAGSTTPNSTCSDWRISQYMTYVYGSKVSSTDSEIRNNTDAIPFYPPIWAGNDTNWMRNDSTDSMDFEILFEERPITAILGGVGYIFQATPGADLQLFAYGPTYNSNGGTVEDPYAGALVAHRMYDPGQGAEIVFGEIDFGVPVSLLVFSNHGFHDIGIDNFEVLPSVNAPEPATMLLFGSGLVGMAGLGRKKFFKRG